MASCFSPVRVQDDGPLGGFDRLDESLLDELIVTGLEGVFLDLVVGFAQDAIRMRGLSGYSRTSRRASTIRRVDGCAGVVESTELPLLCRGFNRVVPDDTERRRDHGIREAEFRTLLSNRGNEREASGLAVSVIR